MVIRRVNRSDFDVFGNTGFDSWSRIRCFHWGLKVIKGIPLDREIINQVETLLHRYHNGSINNI